MIVGPHNGVKYKETFPFIRDGRMWVGYKSFATEMYFSVTEKKKEELISTKKEGSAYVVKDGIVLGRAQSLWFTNLDLKKRHEEIILYRHYTPESYLSYTNLDGIDVPNVSNIPCDYTGLMGVPISYLDQHNPEQFEIVGLGEGNLAKEIGITRNHEGRTKLEYQTADGEFKRPFARIVIRNLHPEQPKEA